MAEMVNLFVWQGKTFDANTGTLRNRILPFGLNAIVAKVYKTPTNASGILRTTTNTLRPA
jgi:hypothetical protein